MTLLVPPAAAPPGAPPGAPAGALTGAPTAGQATGQAVEPTAGSTGHRPRFVLLGGVPGAGKTTLMRAAADRGALPDGVLLVDPEGLRDRLARRLPERLPYRAYRPWVHTVHTLRLVLLMLRGPTRRRRTLVVHDPATRPRRRRWVGRLARWRGWDPVLVVLSVPRETALAGQVRRGRVVAAGSFARHWRRWEEQRPRLVGAARAGAAYGPWSGVYVVDRSGAARVLRAVTRA